MSNSKINSWAAIGLPRAAVRPIKSWQGWLLAGCLALGMSAAVQAADNPGAMPIGDHPPASAVSPEGGSGQPVSYTPAPSSCMPVATEPMPGPTLELSGNRVMDWCREKRFEKKLAQQCSEESGSCHSHHHHCSHCGHCRPGGGCDGDCNECEGHGHSLCQHCGFCRLIDLGAGYGCRFLDLSLYHMTYPIDPWYFDRRDAAVYAAAGFGAPMVIPLAPNVTNQWNYGWGIPSSRLTPISRVTAMPGTIPGAMAPR